MTPCLSSRAFGGLPGPRELALARQFWFLALELFVDDLGPNPDRDARVFASAAGQAGVQVPCVHLGSPNRLDDERTRLDRWRQHLDAGATLGARIAVCHVGVHEQALAARLADEAEDRRIALAFEAHTIGGSSIGELERLLGALGDVGRGHGLCLDLARTRPTHEEVVRLRPRTRWVEASSMAGERIHDVPADDDIVLRELVQAANPEFVSYEITVAGPPGTRPGEAELVMTLRRLEAFHRGGGRTSYRFPTPSV